MYFSPFTPLRYTIEAGLLASLTMTGFSGAIQAYHQDKPTTPAHTEIVTETASPEPEDTSGEIRTDTIGVLSTPTPTPTPTPKPTPKPKAAPAQNEKKSNTSQKNNTDNSIDTKPKSNNNQQQTQKPAAPATQPQQPVQQQPQNVTPAAPTAPSQTYTEEDDDAAWEAQRSANSNNQQKDGALNYGGSQAGTAVW